MKDHEQRELSAALEKFEKALCVQYDGEVMPEDLYRAYRVWHDEVRPALGTVCPVVERTGKHGTSCP